METVRVRLLKFAVIGLIALAFTACSNASIGSYGTNVPGRIAYAYLRFSGTERGSVSLEAGETIELDYEATVEDGPLAVQVLEPNGTSIWEKELTSDDTGTATLTADQEGTYTIVIEGEGTSGSYDVQWTTEDS